MTEQMLDAHALAEVLNVSADTVYRRARTREWPALKVGGQWRFDLTEVKEACNRIRDPWVQSARSQGRKRLR